MNNKKISNLNKYNSFKYSLNSLLNSNEAFKKEFHNNSLFKLMKEGRLSSEEHKNIFFEYYQEFSNQFQRMIFFRSALCENPNFQKIFTQHFDEEYGHDKLLQRERKKLHLKKDPIIQALCAWFPHKMFSTTPAEQLIISNLCIESAAVIIHTYAIPAFDPERKSEYYKIHEEHDCHHEKMGINLLESLSSSEYEQLTHILEDTWSVVNALMSRMGELTISTSR